MNEYANSEAVMYAVRQAENESAKRRKMLAVNPYDGEEVDDSKDKMQIFLGFNKISFLDFPDGIRPSFPRHLK